MRALTFSGKADIRYRVVKDPELISSSDVIVRVKLACICGSDLHVYYARERGLDEGTVMGHEFVGEVVEKGNDVRTFSVGDLVMSPFTTNCGKCYYCHIGLTCRCERGQLYGWVENGRGLQGTQAEYVRVPLADSTLMKIPEGVTLEEGLLLGDILATGFFCARQAEIRPDGVQVVIGCGPVGLMTIVGALECGAKKLFAIDSVPERLAMARQFGAIPIDFSKEIPLEIIKSYNEGRGADAVMEAVGNRNASRLAYEILRPGGILSSVGVCTDSALSFSPVEAYDKNITFKTGRCPARQLMGSLVPMVQQKKYNLTAILTHKMKLKAGSDGYAIFANQKDGCLKLVLEP